MKILRVDEDRICVEFKKTSGGMITFREHYNDLLKNVLNFSNDALFNEDE